MVYRALPTITDETTVTYRLQYLANIEYDAYWSDLGYPSEDPTYITEMYDEHVAEEPKMHFRIVRTRTVVRETVSRVHEPVKIREDI